MLSDKYGNNYKTERSIFPIIRFTKESEEFHCLGSGFFINEFGLFVTAKHVLLDNNGNFYQRMYGLQRLSNDLPVTRRIHYIVQHPKADIAIGFLAEARNGKAEIVDFEITPKFKLSFRPLNISDEILAFGYPRTRRIINRHEYTFLIKGEWSKGIVECFHQNGSDLVKNRCYQTSMFFDTGASGGPVIKDGYVVAINSTSMDCEDPFSFITPIDYLLDLGVPENSRFKPFSELILEGYRGHVEAIY